MIIQAAGTIFALFALSRVIMRYREGRFSTWMLAFWTITWGGVIISLIFPEILETLSKTIGIQRPLDLMLIVGVLLSYYLLFRIYIYLEELRTDLAKIARNIALEKNKK